MKTTMKPLCVAVIASLVFCLTGAVQADWYPDDPAKWVQLPDLDPYTSLDVCATDPVILADDFECTSTGKITDIHIWGSWLDDWMAGSEPTDPSAGDPGAVDFILRICSDIPASQSGQGYSIPGGLLWEGFFPSGSFSTLLADEFPEGWYNPATGEHFSNNHNMMWQYNFDIDPAEAFLQEGTAADPVTYWLSVVALPVDAGTVFGWKTSSDHWQDNAVFGLPGGQWQELYHPHPDLLGFSLDLAFVITPEPATLGVLLVSGLLLFSRRRS